MDIKDITKKIRHLEILTKKNVTEIFVGNYKSSFMGHGLEVSDLRPYAEGDDIRHIDWVTTAKQGTAYVRKYQETRELTTIVVIDLSASMNFTSTGRTKKEIATELASILLFSALKNGDKFGAILFTDTVNYIPPKKGKLHLLRILREIITQYENNSYKKSNLNAPLDFLNLVIKKNTICFFITDDMDTDAVNQLKLANQKHDFIFINIFDEFEKGKVLPEPIEIEDPETGEQILIDLSNKKIREQFIKLRENRTKIMEEIFKKNRIDSLNISTQNNVFKELFGFFQIRS